MEDKRVALLYGILVCAILALGIGVLTLTLGNKEPSNSNDKTSMKVSTKTRRATTSTDTSKTTTSEDITSSSSTSISSESTTTSTSISTSTTITKKITTASTKKITKATKKTTTKTTTRKTTTQVEIPPTGDRETTLESSTYPRAQDDMEWAIFDMINVERGKKGYEYVEVAVEFRRLAEEGADYLYDLGDDEVKKYLYGLNNYRRLSNHLETVDKAILSLYTATIQNTPVTTDPSIRYVGIGVIFREIGLGDRPTYYYTIIYE